MTQRLTERLCRVGVGVAASCVIGASALATDMGSVVAGSGDDGVLTISPMFSSYAVIQRDAPVRLTGTAGEGDTVEVAFNGRRVSAVADDDGAWSADFPSMDAGGPYTIKVTSDGKDLTSHSVLVGDLWVCSGQSNMGWRVEQSANFELAKEMMGDGELRLIDMNRRAVREVMEDVDTAGWRPDRDRYAAAFSAVGYYFGKRLREDLDVPIGLIESSWGGTPAEAWTPMETLEANPSWSQGLLDSLEKYDISEGEQKSLVERYEAEHAAYIEKILELDPGREGGWHLPGFDDSEWQRIDQPGYWEPMVGSVDGVVYLRKTVVLSEAQASGDAVLRFGMIDEYDDTFVNGVRVGGLNYPMKHTGNDLREYAVPAGLLRAGENTVAVRAVDSRTAGGIGGKAEDLRLDVSGGSVSLVGPWRIRVAYDARERDGGFPVEGVRRVPAAQLHRRPSTLYNGMIHGFTDVPVRGFIWYQGESNNGRHEEYGELFPAMISSWRERWRENAPGLPAGGELPFYFVQLPNYRVRLDAPRQDVSGWPALREAQARALELEHTGMAVTMDVGQADDIHPTLKLPVGRRLGDLVLRDVYGEAVEHAASPMLSSVSRRGSSVVVRVDEAAGLRTTDGSEPLAFSLAGGDDVFHWAEAKIEDGAVVVSCDAVPDPVEIRYAWAWNPEVNLVNGGGKPAAPFRARLR